MRLVPAHAPRVVWQEGMYLAPHHFQAQARHAEAEIAHLPTLLTPFAWGLAAVAIDREALANGTLALVHASGRFPDGTPLLVGAAEEAPPPLALADHVSPLRDAHVAYVVIPAWSAGAPNLEDVEEGNGAADTTTGWATPVHGRAGTNGDAPTEPRYAAVTRLVTDEVGGIEQVPVRVAIPRLRLALDDALPPDAIALPVARLLRDGTGHLVVDDGFVPPCLRLSASPRLIGFLDALLAMLEAKGAALAATLGASAATTAGTPAAGTPAAYAGNEVATRWLLHAIRSAQAPLRHLRAVGHVHPERLWTECARLMGALCTFSLTTRADDLPRYTHDDLTGAFDAIERLLRVHLDVVIASRTLAVPFAAGAQEVLGGTLYVAPVTDPRALAPEARWFIAVHPTAGAPSDFAVRAAQLVPQLVKVCGSRFVAELVRRAYPGLPLAHLPAPPATLAPRPGAAYFELTREGPCATAIRDGRDVGAYVPDALGGGTLELVVQLPD
jgi:type VI secretion system protein ImpJ